MLAQPALQQHEPGDLAQHGVGPGEAAPDPHGKLGAADLVMGGGNPQAIVAKVDLTASAD